MKKIKLTQGKYALVDNEDYEFLSKYKWCFSPSGTGYAERRDKKSLTGKIIRMHRFILDAPKDKIVDHKNMNGLDNRRNNLRLCTKSENMRNRNKTRINKSGFKGVYLDFNGQWKAQIKIKGKNVSLGRFDKKVDAAKAYNDKALIEFGEFANLNKLNKKYGK